MTLESFLPQLQHELHLAESLAPIVHGSFSIVLNDVPIRATDLPPGFSLVASLGEPPPATVISPEALYMKLLNGNLFYQTTSGARLGLDDSGLILLQYFYTRKPTYRDFTDALEDFLNTVTFWQTELQRPADSP